MLPTSLDPTVWMELPPSSWDEILKLTGEHERFSGRPFDARQLWESLQAKKPNVHLEDALKSIHHLGTDEGRELIAQAAQDQNLELALPDDVPSRKLAADLWVRSRRPGEEPLARVLFLANVVAEQVTQPRSSFDYVGSRPLATQLDIPRLKSAVLAWSKANTEHEAVEVFVYTRDDTYICEVVRGDTMKRVVEIREGRRSILDFQPAVSDHLRYEPLTGRIAIATRSRRLRETYKRLLGDMLAGDESFFSDANVCNLHPLQAHGAQLFERDLQPEILRIAVTDLHWQRGDRDRLSVRGRDCFKVLDDLGARLHEGTLTDAKLRFFFAGDPPRADVLLRAPNRIEISGSGFRDELVRRVLSDLGILGAAAGSFASLDTWSLFPYRQNAGLWRQRLGTRFDAAIAGGVLRSITLESVAHPDTPDVPGQLTIEPLPDGQRIGVRLDPPALRTLTPTDYLGYELNWNAVANAIVQATDLTGSPRVIEPWLWALGTRALGSADVCVFMAIRRPPPEADLVMAEHAGGARVVIVAPEDCTYRSGVFAIVKADPFGSTFDDVLPRIVTQLGLQHEVPIWLWCRQDLVLDIDTNRAWFRRRELASLALQPFKFAVALADAHGRVVAKHLLNEQLSPSRPDDAAARQAKAAFVKALRSSHEAAGVPCPTEDIFPSRSGGYFVNCSHYVHRATAAETAP